MQLGADALGHSAFAAVGEDLADTVDADNDLVGHGAQGHALPGVAIVGVFADQQPDETADGRFLSKTGRTF